MRTRRGHEELVSPPCASTLKVDGTVNALTGQSALDPWILDPLFPRNLHTTIQLKEERMRTRGGHEQDAELVCPPFALTLKVRGTVTHGLENPQIRRSVDPRIQDPRSQT